MKDCVIVGGGLEGWWVYWCLHICVMWSTMAWWSLEHKFESRHSRM